MKRRQNNFIAGDRHNMRNCFKGVEALGRLKHWSRSSVAIRKGTVARHTTGTQTLLGAGGGGGGGGGQASCPNNKGHGKFLSSGV